MKRSEGHYNKSERTGSGGYAKDEGNGLLDRLRSLFSSKEASAPSPPVQEAPAPTPQSQEVCAHQPEPPKSPTRMLVGMLALITFPYVITAVLFAIMHSADQLEQEQQERQRKERQRKEEERRAIYEEYLKKEQERKERNQRIIEKNNLRPKPKTSSNPIKYLSAYSNISASEYAYCRNLRRVELGCRHIGSKAFLSCSALEKVIVERNLTQVDSRAFADCKRLSTVLFPHTLRKIGSNIFEDSQNIREASLPYVVREQLGAQLGDMDAINTLYVLTDRFFKMPEGLREGNLHRPSARLFVPDALLADFCKDPEWILFNEILPLSQSRWYDADGVYKR